MVIERVKQHRIWLMLCGAIVISAGIGAGYVYQRNLEQCQYDSVYRLAVMNGFEINKLSSCVHLGQGYFLTARHAVNTEPNQRLVVLNVGQARIVHTWDDRDMALIHVDNLKRNFHVQQFIRDVRSEYNLGTGDVLVLSFPVITARAFEDDEYDGPMRTIGYIVKAVYYGLEHVLLVVTDVCGGSSGGAVLADGALIGIVSFKRDRFVGVVKIPRDLFLYMQED